MESHKRELERMEQLLFGSQQKYNRDVNEYRNNRWNGMILEQYLKRSEGFSFTTQLSWLQPRCDISCRVKGCDSPLASAQDEFINEARPEVPMLPEDEVSHLSIYSRADPKHQRQPLRPNITRGA